MSDLMKDITALCKRRGLIYPSSEIYGGFANSWDYGPYGVLLKNNVKQIWWDAMVKSRDDIVGLDSAILMNPKVWEASGHLDQFADTFVECPNPKCKFRYRFPDDFPDVLATRNKHGLYEHSSNAGSMLCNKCGTDLWEVPMRNFNLMFQTFIGPTAHRELKPEEIDEVIFEPSERGGVSTVLCGIPKRHIIEYSPNAVAYLRPETAQGIFVNFKNILDSTRVKIPFGIAQIGKSFRNEITPGNFTFRTREFEQFELEYFVDPKNADKAFEEWKKERLDWYLKLGIDKKKIKHKDHPKKDLAHYAKAVTDIEYEFPFGWAELEGIANRGDYDLEQHQKVSGENLQYTNEAGEKFLPYVIEPSGGVDRAVLAFLIDAYKEEEVKGEKRTVLALNPKLAPIKVAILPLIRKEPLIKMANKIYTELKELWFVEYDESGTVGRRYRRQDEIGTPYCVTVDFDSLEDNAVTVRDRDSMNQERIDISKIKEYLIEKIK
jgi:glycyl-tRNA synthetase